jgi:hypothetical protein
MNGHCGPSHEQVALDRVDRVAMRGIDGVRVDDHARPLSRRLKSAAPIAILSRTTRAGCS